MANVVSALHDMRDAMVKMSLVLRDFQFESDVLQRQAAAQIEKRLTERAKDLD